MIVFDISAPIDFLCAGTKIKAIVESIEETGDAVKVRRCRFLNSCFPSKHRRLVKDEKVVREVAKIADLNIQVV